MRQTPPVGGFMRWVLGLAITLSAAGAHAGELRELRLLDGPESTRVVFDLDAAADNTVFTLSNPDRVVIDIAAAGPRGAKQFTWSEAAKKYVEIGDYPA